MSDVKIGKGDLAGKGVYAARNFAKGETVVAYNLRKVSQTEFDALPKSEHMFVHSFWGEMYLFPEPARYVNNAAKPTTYPDLDARANVALRAIKKGEPITIDDTIELQSELDTFLEAYERAANSRDFNNVDPLIADHATFFFTDGTFTGKDQIRQAFQSTYNKIQDEKYSISSIHWLSANYWEASCMYKFKSTGVVNGKKQTYNGRGTNVLKRLNGNWRIVHEHLSKAV